MKERPILFKRELVLAILDGSKRQTRRTVRPQPTEGADLECRWCTPALVDRDGEMYPGTPVFGFGDADSITKSPYGAPGDRLWVREEHYFFGHWEKVESGRTKTGRQKWKFVNDGGETVVFAPPDHFRKGRHHKDPFTPAWHKRLARFMPRKFSRLTLEITRIRVERLNDISEVDAKAEGAEFGEYFEGTFAEPTDDGDIRNSSYRAGYRFLWECINGIRSWDESPWVWVVEFRKMESYRR